ncbi:Alpha/beta hydrolase fold-3 [Penicillium samsonianum]|uniref:Alpha/beta hydrolase fold-3 n=1 Tax=Penicillium samsonianum TaxID=1882272 RepID=UPI002546A32A|nr:Alpha/beta hydrolase fold-3 [Penicillium samsonianum]KAJ6142523.1 Alpha/beta hydrolase fold-3 [Penicillium samsonianum]
MSITKVTKVKLSIKEKLDFFPAVASIVIAYIYALLTGLRRTERQAKSLSLHLGYALFRKATSRLTPSQMQYILPPSHKIYEQHSKKTGGLPESVELGDGALGHWVGDRNADNVIVWFHGGGFGLPANMGYFKFYTQLLRDLKASGKSVAVFSLTYTLAPIAVYPTQLRQAVNCLRYILSQPNRDPSTVFLGGDSAGGNLVGGVLSHLAHPHAEINSLPLHSNLGGAVMIAPWTLLEKEFPGMEIYNGGDIITEAVAGPWATAYIGAGKRDYYTDLSTAPADWFATFPVNSVLITAGGNEIMLPLIQDFAVKFKEGFENVELFVGHRECHVAPIYHLELGDVTKTEQGKKVEAVLAELMV